MVVVVDQLEELFTVVEPGERARFVARLVTLARSASVVVCLRADYLGRLGELIIDEAGHRFDAIANAPESGLRLSHLPPERYREVIEGPAAAAGITLDDGLAQRLVDAVAREPGGLPLLSFALSVLWERRRGRVLTNEAYDAMDGVRSALIQTAERVWTEAEREPLVAAQIRRILVELVDLRSETTLDTRRRVAEAQLLPDRPYEADFRRALERLVEARLLTKDDALVEIAHEALIREWSRLRRWIDADRPTRIQLQALDKKAAEWARAPSSDALLAGRDLKSAERLLRADPGATRPTLARYLAASRAGRRRARIGIAALGAVGIAALGAVGVIYARAGPPDAGHARMRNGGGALRLEVVRSSSDRSRTTCPSIRGCTIRRRKKATSHSARARSSPMPKGRASASSESIARS
jgi:hypothetical protein